MHCLFPECMTSIFSKLNNNNKKQQQQQQLRRFVSRTGIIFFVLWLTPPFNNMQTEIKVTNLTSSCVFCFHQPLLPQNKIKWIKIHQLQPTDVNPLKKPMFPEKSVRAIYRSEKHTHQVHFLLKSLHLIEKWSNIPYKLVDQSTVVKDMNSPSWHTYDYILSFCILKNKQQSQNQSQMKQWVSSMQQEYVDNLDNP